MTTAVFPKEFADLEPHGDWALDSETARASRRRECSLEGLRAFYDAMIGRVPDALEYLNGFPLSELAGAERNLLHACFAFAEVAPFVEQYHRPVLPEVFDERRMVAMHDNFQTQ